MSRRLSLAAVICATCVMVCGCVSMQSGAGSSSTTPTSAQAGDTTIVAIAPAKGTGMTLPQFLGLNDLAKGLLGLFRQGQSFLGSIYPGLEATPALKSITDPANASSSTPSVSAAANVKSQEDQSRQKIKSLRYLATIGCGGCYPQVEKAFLSGLSDCTESVRLEAVRAIRQTAGAKCTYCNTKSCCSEKIREKLWKLAYGLDDQGCPEEPSARVRRFARMTLKACGTGGVVTSEDDALPDEGPPPETPAPSTSKEGPTGGEATPVAPGNAQSRATSAAEGGDYPVAQAGHSDGALRAVPEQTVQRADVPAPGPVIEVCWERVTAPYARFASPADARAAIADVRLQITGHSSQPPDVEVLTRLESKRFGWTAVEAIANQTARVAARENRPGETSVYSDTHGVHLMRILQRRTRRRAPANSLVTPLHNHPIEHSSQEPRRFVPR